MNLRAAKVWQTNNYQIVWQVTYLDEEKQRQKRFLVADGRQKNFGIRLETEKPSGIIPNGVLVNLLRKYAKTSTILQIQVEEGSGNIWVKLASGGEIYFLLLQKSRPPEIVMMDSAGEVFGKIGQKGSFTKKHQYDGATPSSDDVNLSDLLESLLSQEESDSVEKKLSPLDELEILPKTKEQKEVASRLKRRLKSSKKGLEKIAGGLPKEDDILHLKTLGHLLQNHGYLYKEGDEELTLEPERSGLDSTITIPLDSDKSLGGNIDFYFVQVKKKNRALEMGEKVLKKTQVEIDRISEDLAILKDSVLTMAEVEGLVKKYKLPTIHKVREKGAGTASVPFKTYTASSGQKILVGKGPRENDELAKGAKSNDLWVHVVGTTGTHVLIAKDKTTKDGFPTALIREAGILAIHFSSFRDDRAGEVYVTEKRHIKKKKGMPPGLWSIEKSETIFIRYLEDELRRLLESISS